PAARCAVRCVRTPRDTALSHRRGPRRPLRRSARRRSGRTRSRDRRRRAGERSLRQTLTASAASFLEVAERTQRTLVGAAALLAGLVTVVVVVAWLGTGGGTSVATRTAPGAAQ